MYNYESAITDLDISDSDVLAAENCVIYLKEAL